MEKEIKREFVKESVWLKLGPKSKIVLRRYYDVVTEEPLDKVPIHTSLLNAKETQE